MHSDAHPVPQPGSMGLYVLAISVTMEMESVLVEHKAVLES